MISDFELDGSSDHSLHGSATHYVQSAGQQPFHVARPLPHLSSHRTMRIELNYTDAQLAIVEHTKDSHGTAMCGSYFKHERDDAGNGPMPLVCYAAPSVAG